MLKIGLTGGIGSGKTTVCRIFETLDIPVYYSDIRAKVLMETDPGLVSSLVKIFGSGIYRDHRKLDNKKLAGIVFNDSKLLELLNRTVHPVVLDDFRKWTEWQSGKPYLLLESALLFETGIYKSMDRTICVMAPVEIRIKRIQARDALSVQEITGRIENQTLDEIRIQLADYVINNDEKSALLKQVLKLHWKFTKQ